MIPSLEQQRAETARVDDQLVALAAAEAAHLGPVCEGWPRDRFQALAFSSALVTLKDQLGPYTYAALRSRYDTQRTQFVARLAALGV
jgi:hypothetical protein